MMPVNAKAQTKPKRLYTDDNLPGLAYRGCTVFLVPLRLPGPKIVENYKQKCYNLSIKLTLDMTAAKKQLTHIGTTEYIDFATDDIFGVPAKIDTGADSSAVWASNVHIDRGVLHFNFFAPGSSFYKPEPTLTTAY